MNSRRTFWRRLTGLTGKITFGIIGGSLLLIGILIWLSQTISEEIVLKHELIDLTDESKDNINSFRNKIQQLRFDTLALASDSSIEQWLDSISSGNALKSADDTAYKLFHDILLDKSVDELPLKFSLLDQAQDHWLPGAECEPNYRSIRIFYKDPEDPAPKKFKPLPFDQACANKLHAKQPRAEFYRKNLDPLNKPADYSQEKIPFTYEPSAASLAYIQNEIQNHQNTSGDVYFTAFFHDDSDDYNRQSLWCYAPISHDDTETRAYVAIELNVSRIMRDYDRYSRLMLMAYASKTQSAADKHPAGRFLLRSDFDLCSRNSAQVLNRNNQNAATLKYRAPNSAALNADEEFLTFTKDNNSDWITLGDRFSNPHKGELGQIAPGKDGTGHQQCFMVGYVTKDVVRQYWLRERSKTTAPVTGAEALIPIPAEAIILEPDKKYTVVIAAQQEPVEMNGDEYLQLRYYQRLYYDFFMLREQFPTLRFSSLADDDSLKNSLNNFRFIVIGGYDQAWFAEQVVPILHKYQLEKYRTQGNWLTGLLYRLSTLNYAQGSINNYVMYLEKVYLEDKNINNDAVGNQIVLGSAAGYEEIKADISQGLNILKWLGLLSGSVCLLLAVFFSKQVTKPLKVLKQGIDSLQLETDHSTLRLPEDRADEIGDLARAFSEMNSRLQTAKSDLEYEKIFAQNVLKNIGEGIVTLNKDLTIKMYNYALWRDIYKTTATRFSNTYKGKHFSKLLVPRSWDQAAFTDCNDIFSSVESGQLTIMSQAAPPNEALGIREDGSTFPLEYIVKQFSTMQNGFDELHFAVIVRDITERKRLQTIAQDNEKLLLQQVEQRTKELADQKHAVMVKNKLLEEEKEIREQMSKLINHDIKNYLTPIKSGIANLRLFCQDTEAEEDFAAIAEASDSIEKLCKKANAFQSTDQALPTERFHLAQLLREIASESEYLAKMNSNTLLIENIDQLTEVESHSDTLRSIVVNLINNACKFTNHGTITIAGKVLDENILLDIRDTGFGMTPEQIKLLFKPSPRILSLEQNPTGTGLGLATCRRLCKVLDIDIMCLKSTPGKGTTFRLNIPKHRKSTNNYAELDEQHANTNAADSLSNSTEMPTILIIDDNHIICDQLSKHLHKLGKRILTAKDGTTGLEIARTVLPVLITLDLMMPGMDGWTVLTSLKSDPRTKHIPIIIISVDQEQKRGFSLGAADYFTKPDIDWERLTLRIRELVKPESNRLVLVIDDQKSIRAAFREVLSQDGWLVSTANDGLEGLSELHRQRPALILLDLMMPRMDGFEFLDKLRDNPDYHDIPVIVITGMELDDHERARLQQRVYSVICKGTASTDELFRRIEERIHSILKLHHEH